MKRSISTIQETFRDAIQQLKDTQQVAQKLAATQGQLRDAQAQLSRAQAEVVSLRRQLYK